MATKSRSSKQLLPIECNPTPFNNWLTEAGVSELEFVDVFSLDQDMLAFIPRPVLALVLLIPVPPEHENDELVSQDHEGIVWYPQTIENACGSMAFLHALANAIPSENIEPHGFARQLLDDTVDKSTADRAKYLEASQKFEDIHQRIADLGATDTSSSDDAEGSSLYHFKCLTKSKSGELIELDGRSKGPVRYGIKVGDLLDAQTVGIIQQMIAKQGDNCAFSMLALVNS